MAELLALLDCQVGRAVAGKFAAVAGQSASDMRAAILEKGPLGAYFVQVVKQVVAELKAEEEAA